MIVLTSILLAYLLGAIPFGLLIAKAHHIDLRRVGSGNIGATNVARAVGKKWGYFCFFLDLLKGFIPTLLCLLWIKPRVTAAGFQEGAFLWMWLGVGCAAIAGHIFPIYTGGKGGKGVATSFGVALGLWPYFTGCALLAFFCWGIIVVVTRYISVASVAAATLFPIYFLLTILYRKDWAFGTLWPLQLIANLIPVIVAIRHLDNLKRVLKGTENKVQKIFS